MRREQNVRSPHPSRLRFGPVPVRVKICGVTTAADAIAAVDAGADALGFMFFENSKRFISPAAAGEIIRELPPFVAKVGVFVNAPKDFVLHATETSGIDTLQFHGEETPRFCGEFPLKVIKAFRVRSPDTLQEALIYRSFAWLLDSYVDGQHGGTGIKFDWNIAVKATQLTRMVILAGGLKVDTVAEAVRTVRPYGVDVSGGVESSPGRKDHAKLREFILAAKGPV